MEVISSGREGLLARNFSWRISSFVHWDIQRRNAHKKTNQVGCAPTVEMVSGGVSMVPLLGGSCDSQWAGSLLR